MKLPRVGQLIRYAYLWHDEHRRGLTEGSKDRPCAVVIAAITQSGDRIFYVAPVTSRTPGEDALAVEIPAATRQRLGLDAAPCWIVTAEVNKFIWPGPDLRPGDDGEAVIGFLPASIVRRVIENLRRHAGAVAFRSVDREV
ncbi:MAG: hypothetical protein ACT4OE_03180 [Sphingosinicella sp.]